MLLEAKKISRKGAKTLAKAQRTFREYTKPAIIRISKINKFLTKKSVME